MAETLTFIGVLKIVTCGSCGTVHAIPEDLQRQAKETGKKWYCPTGCHITYVDNEVSKLKKQIEQKDNTIQWMNNRNDRLHTELTSEKHRSRSLKAAKTRLKNRVKNGVCPCCNRTFSNLLNHMKTEHPEFRS